MKKLYSVVLIYFIIWTVASQEINSTYSTWFNATSYCSESNKSLVSWNENITGFYQFKRDHASVLRITSMWVGNNIHFRYTSGTGQLRVDQNSADWLQAAKICSLWSPSYIVQPLASKGAFANGTVTFDSNTSIVEETYYWTDLVKKMYLHGEFYPLQAGFDTECGYVEYKEPSIQFGDCNQVKAVLCDNSANSCTDMNIERCSLPSIPNVSAVYVGVSVGGLACLVAVVVAAKVIHKRRVSTKVDADRLKRQSTVHKQTDDKSDHQTANGSVNYTNTNLEMNVIYPSDPREFDANKDGIAYASFDEYQPTGGGPSDLFSGETYEPVGYGISSRSDRDASSPVEDSEYYPIHGQMATNGQAPDNTLTDGSDLKTDDATDKCYEYMVVISSRASGHVQENSNAFVNQNTTQDAKLFTVENFTYTSI